MANQNRIFPPWNEINNFKVPLMPGERYLANFLDKYLDNDWKIFLKTVLDWGGAGKTPDIVISHKTHGVMIFEVKDIDLNAYSRKTFKNKYGKKRNLLCLNKHGENIIVKDPIKQIEDYKDLMIEEIPEIIDYAYGDKEFEIPIKGGLYFHLPNSKKKANQILKYHNSQDIIVFDRDDLSKENINKVILNLNFENKMLQDSDWFTKFDNWIMPPLHKVEDGINLSFNTKQKRYIDTKPKTRQKLSGVAGSGKTLVLAMRAATLASLGKKVLVLCYNITLKHYIKRQIKKAPRKFHPNDIHVMHFHGFLKRYASKFEMEFPFLGNTEENLSQWEKNIIHHRRNHKDYFNYDAVLIDEGQDFNEEWYKFICDFLNENQEVVYAVDEKQNIYKKDLKWVGKGRWGILNQGYRLPKEKIKIINNFSRLYLDRFDHEIENPDIIPPDDTQLSLLPSAGKSYWKDLKYFSESKEQIYKTIIFLKDVLTMKMSDIVILIDTHKEGLEIKNFLEETLKDEAKIMDIFSLNGSDKKYKFRVNSPHLKMSTIHSFKGWEARNVIILIPQKVNIDSQIYTSLTRVQENLFILNLNQKYTDFGKNNFNKFDF
jgi:hypothetical protein